MPSDRCGYTSRLGGTSVDRGDVCCWRPVWGDRDRCVWHAVEEHKPVEEMERLAPGPGERLDGLHVEETVVGDRDWFAGCVLVRATFRDANLNGADLTDADLRQSVFDRSGVRDADLTGANLEGALFRDTDLRGATVAATPLGDVAFANAYVDADTDFGIRSVYEVDPEGYELAGRMTAAEAAISEYRQLQRLYRANDFPKEARRYYVRERDVSRRFAWRDGDYRRALWYEGTRWVMGYGGNPWRVLGTSLALILVCALLFPLVGGIQEVGADRAITYAVEDPSESPVARLVTVFLKSLYFSVVTFATLGYGDIQPATGMGRAIASVETLLGSLLMALLVFVLSRSVTW